jgi:hypothetical protein
MTPHELSEFDAFEWIKNYFADYTDLDYHQLRPVLSFSLIWNLFETVACNTRANATSIRRAVDDAHQAESLDQPKYMRYVEYFKARYLVDGDLAGMFRVLVMNDPESQVVVRRVLHGETRDTDNIVYGLLLIAHRIRNNLFHGNKGIETLPQQTELFCAVNRLLADFVEDLKLRGRFRRQRRTIHT